MRFEVRHRLPGSPAAVLDVLADPAYVAQLGTLPSVDQPEVVEHRVVGDELRQRLRYRFARELPTAVTAVIDPDRLVWVDETTWVLSDARASFRIVPVHEAKRLQCSGTISLQPDDGGSTRLVAGDVTVRYPLVRRVVERAIVGGVEEHLTHEAELIASLLTSTDGP